MEECFEGCPGLPGIMARTVEPLTTIQNAEYFRSMIMKIFGIGLSRTGTTSLTLALSELGLHAHHFPRTRELIDAVDAVTDTPVALWYRELEAAYPGSMFILTLRHLPDWLDSCEALWQTASPFDEFTSGIHHRLYGCEDFDRDTFAAVYAHHGADVINHFAGLDDDLLLMDICAGQGWEQLCPFLGFPRPSTPFPHRNRRTTIGHDWVDDCPPRKDSRGTVLLPFHQESIVQARIAG